MLAEDFMTKDIISCTENQTVGEAAQIMEKNGFSVIPVVDGAGLLLGIVTEADFVGRELNIPHALASIKQLMGQIFYFSQVEKIYSNAKSKKLSEVMTRNPPAATPKTSLTSLINHMIAKELKKILIVEEGKLVGLITYKDIIRAFNRA